MRSNSEGAGIGMFFLGENSRFGLTRSNYVEEYGKFWNWEFILFLGFCGYL